MWKKSDLIDGLDALVDLRLASLLVDEFMSIEARYVLRDWEPAELDGGQFAEILARILFLIDHPGGSQKKQFADCVEYIEDDDSSRSHALGLRGDALLLCRLLRFVYKVRSSRGAVHISNSYGPNEIDARVAFECCRWCFCEFLRMFWSADRELIESAIKDIVQFDVPAIREFDGVKIVQRTDLTGEEEVLLVIYGSGNAGVGRTQIGKTAKVDPATVTRALKSMSDRTRREVVDVGDKHYRITDLGIKRVRDELSAKLGVGSLK